MDWIKRNLFFVVGGVIALGLMGAAGWFLYTKWDLNNQIRDKLNQDYAELENLNKQKPHPGAGQIDNVKLAREQIQAVREAMQKTTNCFQPIIPIPDTPKVTERDYSAALSRTIVQLQNTATNSSVNLPPDYNFSFAAQKQQVTFATGSLEPLAAQLGEVKAICDVLFQAKVNSLDNIRRVRISSDDSKGPPGDYLFQRPVTNELAILIPYELTFRCFSAELAAVLSGFAASSNGLIVNTINVEQAPAGAVDLTMPVAGPGATPPPMVGQPAMPQRYPSESDFASRYGLGGGRGSGRYNRDGGGNRYGVGGGGMGGIPLRDGPAPAYTPPTVAQPQPGVAATSPTTRGGLPTVLDEKLLKVTLVLDIVKLVPPPAK